MAINLNRQITIVELPGGNAGKARTLAGPYLFGAEEDLTPPRLTLRDMDGDGTVDLVLNICNEQVVYLNADQHDVARRIVAPATSNRSARW